jgi:hypothetical protein
VCGSHRKYEQYGSFRVIFESDSLSLVNALKSGDADLSDIGVLYREGRAGSGTGQEVRRSGAQPKRELIISIIVHIGKGRRKKFKPI